MSDGEHLSEGMAGRERVRKEGSFVAVPGSAGEGKGRGAGTEGKGKSKTSRWGRGGDVTGGGSHSAKWKGQRQGGRVGRVAGPADPAGDRP